MSVSVSLMYRWFIAHGPNGAFNHNEYGLDMSKGKRHR